MDWTTQVAVHESAAPEFARERIIAALERRELDVSLLYSGLRQTSRWTALHHAVSPAKADPAVARLYETVFDTIRATVRGNVVHVVSLACGDGTKDLRCLSALRGSGRAVIYTPADISFEMVLSARKTVCGELRGLQCTPLMCDLARCSVLPAILKGFDPSGAERVILFLGAIQNCWPPDLLKSVLYPLRAQDHLLISANLAPANDYDAALARIMTQYDNALTRDWLMGALSELGLSEAEGDLKFETACTGKLKRIEASFVFRRAARVPVFDRAVAFEPGQKLRVFYSHRFTPAILRKFLEDAELAMVNEWISDSEEEGLFLCRRR